MIFYDEERPDISDEDLAKLAEQSPAPDHWWDDENDNPHQAPDKCDVKRFKWSVTILVILFLFLLLGLWGFILGASTINYI